jgi:hypothetical protein
LSVAYDMRHPELVLDDRPGFVGAKGAAYAEVLVHHNEVPRRDERVWWGTFSLIAKPPWPAWPIGLRAALGRAATPIAILPTRARDRAEPGVHLAAALCRGRAIGSRDRLRSGARLQIPGVAALQRPLGKKTLGAERPTGRSACGSNQRQRRQPLGMARGARRHCYDHQPLRYQAAPILTLAYEFG